MKNIIRVIAFGGIMATAASSFAQNTNSGYFIDNYTYRYQLNPAYANDRGFVSFPGLGNLNIGTEGTLNLTDILYNYNGKTVLFSNPNISTSEVMSKISDRNSLGFNTRINILSAGFKAFGGYNTISIGARADVGLAVPGAFFSLVKEGVSNRTYDIHHLGASALGYAEIALNHSRDIKQVPGLRAGIAVKVLVGVANVEANFNKADLTLGENEWTITSDADVYVNFPKAQFERKYSEKLGRDYVSGVNFDGDGSIGPNGYGVAFDLGATYQWRDLTFSLAALDLGFISFSDTKYATTNGEQTFNTDEYIFKPNDFDSSWDDFADGLEKLYQLEEVQNFGSRKRTLGATLNVGVDYAFPLYRKLHFGLLSSTRIAGQYSWTEARLSANVAPVKCFSAGVNVAAGTYGVAFGWMLNYSYTGFNIFVGMDNTHCKLAKQGVPLNSNMAFNFGINFPF